MLRRPYSEFDILHIGFYVLEKNKEFAKLAFANPFTALFFILTFLLDCRKTEPSQTEVRHK
jgi:hypothetical protein